MPRFAEDYEWLTNQVEAALIELLATYGALLNQSVSGEERRRLALGLQHALNAQLEADRARPENVNIFVGAASSVPSQGVFLRVMLEVIADGMKVGVWTVDYDGQGRLTRCPPGYIRVEIVDADERGQP